MQLWVMAQLKQQQPHPQTRCNHPRQGYTQGPLREAEVTIRKCCYSAKNWVCEKE